MPTKLLKKDEELALARDWLENKNERARARLVLSYGPLIRAQSRKFMRPGLTKDDLYQEGVIGFMAGLDNFNPDLGHSIGTLARFHIAAHMQHFVSEFAGVMRLPNSRRIKGLVNTVIPAIRIMESKLGRTLEDKERETVCIEAGFTLAELHDYEQALRPAKVLGTPTGGEDGQAFDLSDPGTKAPESEHAGNQASEIVERILSDFDERTRKILTLRHMSDEFNSLESIAGEIGISRERVRRIEMQALDKFRKALVEAGVTDFTDLV